MVDAPKSPLSHWQPLGIAALVTTWAGLSSLLLPDSWSANAVGAAFFGASYFLVLRHNATFIGQYGLSFGGLFEPEPLRWSNLGRELGSAALWALLAGLVFLPAFAVGYQFWWQPRSSYHLVLGESPLSDLVTQVLAVALPEEMFYRGYLQSELERVWKSPQGPWTRGLSRANLVTSAVFALGHLVTIPHPARLAVFFPSLAFGWLRARTGGIGASVLFHAFCNLFALSLGRGYGFFQ